MKPIALVIPWYGDNIRGGAEMECNYLAHSLAKAGACVEVFTTCVQDASCDRGKNTLPAGENMESGILVRRFKVRKRDVDRFTAANLKIYHNNNFTIEDEKTYFEEDINSPDMCQYIRMRKNDYRCFIFIPYMYGITYNCSEECMDKAILIPCLHDESYGYMKVLKGKMPRFRGMIFHAKPEYELAHRLYNLDKATTAVLGEGIDTEWHSNCDAQSFRDKYGIKDDFILFAGRKDAGKKADELVSFFIGYKKLHLEKKLKLILIGGGTLLIPEEFKTEVVDLGFVSVEDKHNAFAAAKFLCNPSYFESFSLVIMESWLAKRPVLVSQHCAVTTNFCLETNGGLYYNNFSEFCGCVDYLLNHEKIADQMGQNGFRYVIENFAHEKIAEKYLTFINEIGI